jgi:hypothetical protein
MQAGKRVAARCRKAALRPARSRQAVFEWPRWQGLMTLSGPQTTTPTLPATPPTSPPPPAQASTGVLLCTDVAARGLDFPKVTAILQYDPAGEPAEYVHRVGRTARLGQGGEALMLLLPGERGYVELMAERGVALKVCVCVCWGRGADRGGSDWGSWLRCTPVFVWCTKGVAASLCS